MTTTIVVHPRVDAAVYPRLDADCVGAVIIRMPDAEGATAAIDATGGRDVGAMTLYSQALSRTTLDALLARADLDQVWADIVQLSRSAST